MRRKRYQRGSLKPRKRDGRRYWYAQWRENGAAKSKELGLCSIVTRIEAEAQLSAILQPINEGAGGKIEFVCTFGQFIDDVYLKVFRNRWKASTAMTEEDRIRCHLSKELGPRLLKDIRREELQALLDDKAHRLSRSGITHLRFRLRSILGLAMSEGLLDRNPATELYTPRHSRPDRQKRLLTPDEASQLLAVLDIRERLIARLATWEGMRPGEILGLQVGDVDSDSVWVRRRLYRCNLDDPKSKRAARRVALSLGTATLLISWIEGLSWAEPQSWLFPSESGETPVSRDNVWRRKMLPRLKQIGLEWATFQVMRRTFASLSKQAGVDAHTRSAQMGNTVDVNENEYAIASFEEKLKAVRKLEATVLQ